MSVPRLLVIAVLLAALALGLVTGALANNPKEYYSFRVSSALPGMLFGVTPEGDAGFAGAFQQNIPVAFTPGNQSWVLGGNSGSNSSAIELGLSGAKVNGTGFIGKGWGGPGQRLYVSWEATSDKIEEAWNLQYQFLNATERRPALALGAQDIFNERERYIGQARHNARSLYLTATGALSQATWRPIYWTAGWGNGRFRRGFVGLSAPVSDHWRLVGEYDSFNANAGLAWGMNGLQTDRRWDLMGYFGYTDLKRPVLGLSATFR
jgi:hypothetical protein